MSAPPPPPPPPSGVAGPAPAAAAAAFAGGAVVTAPPPPPAPAPAPAAAPTPAPSGGASPLLMVLATIGVVALIGAAAWGVWTLTEGSSDSTDAVVAPTTSLALRGVDAVDDEADTDVDAASDIDGEPADAESRAGESAGDVVPSTVVDADVIAPPASVDAAGDDAGAATDADVQADESAAGSDENAADAGDVDEGDTVDVDADTTLDGDAAGDAPSGDADAADAGADAAPPVTVRPVVTVPDSTPAVAGVEESAAIVRNGQIFLEGAVPSVEVGAEIEALAAEVLGPDNVFNNYVVDPNAGDPNIGNITVEDTITFATNSAVIQPSGEPLLNQGLALLGIRPNMTITIVGHTDTRGDAETNLVLSQARADAVKAWFVEREVDAERLSAVGAGETEPLSDETTAEAHRLNRRIQFFLENVLG